MKPATPKALNFETSAETLPIRASDHEDQALARELAKHYAQKAFELRVTGTNFIVAANGAGLAVSLNGVISEHLQVHLISGLTLAAYAGGVLASYVALVGWRRIATTLQKYYTVIAKGDDATAERADLISAWRAPITDLQVAMYCLVLGTFGLFVMLFGASQLSRLS